MNYEITPKIIALVQALFDEGYTGTAQITNRYATGTKKQLGDCYSVELSGFCKETLHLAGHAQIDHVIFMGRYDLENSFQSPTVSDIVRTAWGFYKHYKRVSNFSLPDEFKTLFFKYGYLTEETVTVLKEAD